MVRRTRNRTLVEDKVLVKDHNREGKLSRRKIDHDSSTKKKVK